MQGLVIRGSRNIFSVKTDDSQFYECRIKGKVLKNSKDNYNPIAPGDIVDFEADNKNKGMITNVATRRNIFSRYNRKGRCSQLIACNVDKVIAFTSPASPPFRPRFIDRVLLQTEFAEIPAIILVNKIDLECNADRNFSERINDYKRIGYDVLKVSGLTGEGLDELHNILKNKLSVFIGQSGVGKSFLINKLLPNVDQKTGSLNEKYDRGNHTTVLSQLFESDNIRIVDTPGVRQLVPDGIKANDIIFYMKEFAPFAGLCSFGASCTHSGEAGCKITEVIENDGIQSDRLTSFLSIKNELLAEAAAFGKF
jgi:ribosome biogenesis GTPase